ncbi:MAG: ABC transporter ATP-binding protein [Oscillospiraceae bacterium]
MNDLILQLQNIEKSFGEAKVLRGIRLDVHRGEFITLLGPSGCGKTTTLRIIAGLETPDSGRVLLEGQDVTDEEPNKRNVNTVFQNYALFPHMTVAANIGYSLKLRKVNKAVIKETVDEALSLVQLAGFGDRMPDQLSGGQRQRVAIARAIVNEPKVLLLDEPLGALDLQLRRQMQTELKRLQKRLGITFIYITHDQEEALNMSDRIVVMREGILEQVGTPAQIYDRPKTSYVATFVGAANVLHGKLGKIEGDTAFFESENGRGQVLLRGAALREGDSATISLRGEHVHLAPCDEGTGMGLSSTITEKTFAGGALHITLELKDGSELISGRHGIDSTLAPGDRVCATWKPENAVLVDLPDGEI